MTDRTDQSARMLAGRCLCGTVQYVVADEFRYAANCHCTDCRRTTGSAFKPFAGIEGEKFSVIKGADHLHTYGEEKAHDARCGKCGSFLYSVVRDGAYVHVALGPLANEPTIRPSEHIFVGSKAPWFTITDDLPQYRAHVADGPPMNR
ncbi:aldehyde-activating protein [Sinorhizobium fredii USDA 205]|uniref:GFA family protein n=1 Tax=Rhizobium fredii TaxID=380 RepID=A0A844ABD3_RHIFR|nr:GFA family protein [Sinorhizobium fredii]KSV85325.1 aldehyde-activating protein [Sinorhizobium fredii USDA 205]MCG5473815.1 GFA family protein [Sinorhizobium fredii]MQW98571.1 GFA family protein [Sinorhizobium fredii]MQX10484.1 GFA family protein [Sinorhizobium fredii]UTY46097.1 GFA family protein [Sinorhizobium fredii]